MALTLEHQKMIKHYIDSYQDVPISNEARERLSFMERNHMKDLFGKMEVFQPMLEQCRKDQKNEVLKIPKYVERLTNLEEGRTSLGNRYFKVTPKNGSGSYQYNILYFHGGGYMLQIQEQWDFICFLAMELNGLVTVPIYPLIPTYTYKEMYSYIIDVYEDVLQKGLGDERVFIGDSAGGYLSVALAQLALQQGLPQPKTIIPISPQLDLSDSNDASREALCEIDPMIGMVGMRELGKYLAPDIEDRTQFPPSPLFGPLEGLAPMHIFVGSREVLLTDAFAMQERGIAEGIEIDLRVFEGMWHCFAAMMGMPESDEAHAQILSIITA